MNPGEYLSPFVRKTFVQAPVISGYVTARLYAEDQLLPPISGPPDIHLFTFDNVGDTNFAFKLQQTEDRGISGIRLDVTGTIALVPGGQTTTTASPIQHYLEVLGLVGAGELRMSIDAQRRWRMLAFDKTDPFSDKSWRVRPLPTNI